MVVNSLGQRSNSTLVATLGVLVAALLGYYYVAPTVTTLGNSRLATAALALDKTAYETRIGEVVALDARLRGQPALLDRLTLAVPPDAAIDELIVSLEALAAGSGIVLATVQPVVVQEESGTKVSVTARGSYGGLRLFLEQLASNLRPIKVTELTLTAASDVSGASLVNASFQLVAAQAGVSPSLQTDQTEPAASQSGGTRD